MKTSKKLAVAAIVMIGSFVVAPAAYAGLTNQSFSTTLPNLQQPRLVGNQAKTYGSSPGYAHISNVGSDYLVNVRMYHSPTRRSGTEIRRLNDGQGANLPNSFAAGTTQLQLALVNDTWTYVQVSVSGYWRSH